MPFSMGFHRTPLLGALSPNARSVNGERFTERCLAPPNTVRARATATSLTSLTTSLTSLMSNISNDGDGDGEGLRKVRSHVSNVSNNVSNVSDNVSNVSNV